MVHGILLARVPPGDAEDLVQDVFLGRHAATARPAHGGGVSRLAGRDRAQQGAWTIIAAGAGRRRSKTQPRRGRRRTGRVPGAGAIRSLPEAYRETLILRLVEGMTGPEIAERTGLTPESVRVNLCRGMKMLRELLEAK